MAIRLKGDAWCPLYGSRPVRASRRKGAGRCGERGGSSPIRRDHVPRIFPKIKNISAESGDVIRVRTPAAAASVFLIGERLL